MKLRLLAMAAALLIGVGVGTLLTGGGAAAGRSTDQLGMPEQLLINQRIA